MQHDEKRLIAVLAHSVKDTKTGVAHHESLGLCKGAQADSHDLGQAAHYKHGGGGNGHQQRGQAARCHVSLDSALQSSNGAQAQDLLQMPVAKISLFSLWCASSGGSGEGRRGGKRGGVEMLARGSMYKSNGGLVPQCDLMWEPMT